MEDSDIADEGLADFGEGEAAGGAFSVFGNDEVAVLLVDLGGPGDGAAVEELLQVALLRLVDVRP